jgi:glycosyltransferase involved in cell wall biosynthesis
MNKKQKKIAILLPSLKFGGAERVSLNLATEMKLQGISIDILVMSKEGEFLAEAEEKFRVYDLRCDRTYKLPYNLIKYAFNNHPDGIISNFFKLNLCACIARLFSPSTRLILWEHAPPSMGAFCPIWLYSLLASIFYQFSTKVVAVSNGVAADIASRTIGINGKLVTIYNPIVPPNQLLLKKKPDKNYKRSIIISLGRLEPEKNTSLLIESFALLPKQLNARLLIVGDGTERRKLEQLCIDLNVQKKIKFLGFINNPYEILINADLLVLSSNFEGFGNVIAEALYCGLPVVSTDCKCGPRELLANGMYGSLVAVNDKNNMANAIKFELKKRRLPEIQKYGAQRFLPNVIANKFIDLII